MSISNAHRLAVIVESASLPEGLYWYDVGGNTIFPVYAQDGIFYQRFMSFLIDKTPEGPADLGTEGLHEECGGRWYTLRFNGNEPIEPKISAAIEALRPRNVN